MGPRKKVIRQLASVMLNGRLSRAGLMARGARILGRRPACLNRLADKIISELGIGRRPRIFRLEQLIRSDPSFQKAFEKRPIAAISQFYIQPRMCPADGPPEHWNLPAIHTQNELAQWLNLMPNELEWFADCRSLEAKVPEGPLRHYNYRWQSKKDGSARLIEAPKHRLKCIQRKLLTDILNSIPTHNAVHGFRSKRSILSFVKPHVGKFMVLKLDLKDFFPSILRAHIMAIFLTAGYPETVSRFLTGLCTNSASDKIIKACPGVDNFKQLRRAKLLYTRPHLPQGAPTSPALANLAAYHLDCRLEGLAKAVDASYTRYADDLVFSGGSDFGRMIKRFYIRACAIALEEGFEVNTHKTRIMPQSVTQRAAGVVINQKTNAPRVLYDQLKAVIHNCIKHGPDEQNRTGIPEWRAHLMGRIAHVEMLNPERGSKLWAAFNLIRW